MDANALTALVNTGIGGAIIAVVLIFLNFITKRDEQWRQFFKDLNQENEELKRGVADLTTVTGQLVQEVREMRGELTTHDKRVDCIENRLDAYKPRPQPRQR